MLKRIAIFLLLCSTAFAANTSINAFNAGEFSPLLDGRTDIQKYYSGCQTLENMLVMSYGGAERRPGLSFIAEVKDSSKKVRVVSFEFSTEQAYILEFGDLYLRFYKDGAQILDGAPPYEIVTTYLEADLPELQFIQSADIMFIAHPDYATRQLTRTGDTAWTITDMVFERGPFLDENETSTTITPSAITGSGITLTASSAIFVDPGHIGSIWEISYDVVSVTVEGSFAGTGSSSTTPIQLGRTWSFSTGGTWNGTVQLQKSYDGGTLWSTVAGQAYPGSARNINSTGTETVDDAIYRVNMLTHTSGTLTYGFTANGFQLNGVVEITAIASTTSATADVKVDLGDTAATKIWSEGAWSDYRGYPSALAFYEERLTFANSLFRPQTIWFSETNAWNSFRNDTGDSDAMTFTIAADQVNAIRWMVPKTALILGTSGGEWTISANSADEALTPTNVKAVRHSTYGNTELQAIAVNNVVLFAERQARKIRELTFSFEIDDYVAPNMTVLSEHITRSGMVDMAYQSVPDSILWTVLGNGNIAAMTYNREQDVVGWHRHVTEGSYESIAVIPGTEDEVWVSVLRSVNGSDVRYVEQFQARDYGDDQADVYFVDSGVTYNGGETQTVTNITQADPGVVTVTTWLTDIDGTNMANGDHVFMTGIVGMVELNNLVFEVANVNVGTKTFSLKDETGTVDYNTTAFTAYSSGGTAEMVAKIITVAHLEDETVTVCGDGAFDGEYTVASNIITASDYYNTIHVGLPYTSIISPMKLNVPLQDGTMMGRTKRIIDLTMRFYKTLSCNAGPSITDFTPVDFRSDFDEISEVPPAFTGDKDITWTGSYEKEGTIVLFTDQPLPMTVLSLMPNFEVGR